METTFIDEYGVIYNADKTVLIKAPRTINGHYYIHPKVEVISPSAFQNCKNIQKIIIPESVNYIGRFAFVDCCELTEIHIPNSVLKIRQQTFSNCKKLSSITLPNSMVSIEPYAFYKIVFRMP